MWLANLRFTQPSNELKMNNVMKGRDVATDIKVTIFSQTITGAMQTSHLPICYACPFMPNNIIVKSFEWQLQPKPSEHKKEIENDSVFFVVVVTFLHNIFSQYRGQCNRKPFYVSFIKSLKGIMLNGWILFFSKKALK